jgi:hypothetical protein
MKYSSETLGVSIFYRSRLAVIKDSDGLADWTVGRNITLTWQERRDSEEDAGQKMSRTVKSEFVNL